MQAVHVRRKRERDEVPEIDAPCDGGREDHDERHADHRQVEASLRPEKEEHHLQEQEADGDALQNVDLPEDLPCGLPRFIAEVVVIEFRDVEDVGDEQYEQEPPELFEERGAEREIVVDLPPGGDGVGHPGGEQERRCDQPVDEPEDLEESAVGDPRGQGRIEDMRLDHDNHRPSSQEVDELDPFPSHGLLHHGRSRGR